MRVFLFVHGHKPLSDISKTELVVRRQVLDRLWFMILLKHFSATGRANVDKRKKQKETSQIRLLQEMKDTDNVDMS